MPTWEIFRPCRTGSSSLEQIENEMKQTMNCEWCKELICHTTSICLALDLPRALDIPYELCQLCRMNNMPWVEIGYVAWPTICLERFCPDPVVFGQGYYCQSPHSWCITYFAARINRALRLERLSLGVEHSASLTLFSFIRLDAYIRPIH